MPDKVEPAPYGDFVLPFDMAKVGVRGRLVRLDAASARALSAHALPEPAARVAGEVVALGALDPEAIVTPGIFVKAIVQVPRTATQAGGFIQAA
jgi:hypothetical protein